MSECLFNYDKFIYHTDWSTRSKKLNKHKSQTTEAITVYIHKWIPYNSAHHPI